MEISIKTQSAVALMAELALQQGKGPTTLASVSMRLGLSISYLENVARNLRLAGMIRATKGPGGGYQLARPAQDVTVGEVMRVIEPLVSGSPDSEASVESSALTSAERDVTDALLMRYLHVRQSFLDRRSIQSLLRRPDSASSSARAASLPELELEVA